MKQQALQNLGSWCYLSGCAAKASSVEAGAYFYVHLCWSGTLVEIEIR